MKGVWLNKKHRWFLPTRGLWVVPVVNWVIFFALAGRLEHPLPCLIILLILTSVTIFAYAISEEINQD